MENYTSVIGSRYQAPLLNKIWCSQNKIKTMRLLWFQLAKVQYKLGLKEIINETGLQELEEHLEVIDLNKIDEYEKIYAHDIMAHIHAYSDLCPNAKSFIHLGATSNYINDNCDLILMRNSLQILIPKIESLFDILKELSLKYINTPTLAYTHLQKAQLITIGKRFAMYNSELYNIYQKWIHILEHMEFRGVRGTVGSEDSILKIMGNREQCKLLNEKLATHFGFTNIMPLCNQTYSRSIDVDMLHLLSILCQFIYKMSSDMRLLSSKEEVYEAFGEKQVGSSAMPYKKNPIHCEKLCSLCRYVVNQESAMVQTYMAQWLERSLDDSAIKRIVLPESFLLSEHILDSSIQVFKNLVFNLPKIEESVHIHMKHIISEELIIRGVKAGFHRNEIHEYIRNCTVNNISYANHYILKDLIKEISYNPNDYIGNCVELVNEFYAEYNIPRPFE